MLCSRITFGSNGAFRWGFADCLAALGTSSARPVVVLATVELAVICDSPKTLARTPPRGWVIGIGVVAFVSTTCPCDSLEQSGPLPTMLARSLLARVGARLLGVRLLGVRLLAGCLGLLYADDGEAVRREGVRDHLPQIVGRGGVEVEA